MKLSIGKAWEEASAFLSKEARLVAPVALATFALPAVLADWAYPGGSGGGNAGLLLILVLLVVLIGQMTIVLLAAGWSGSIGEAMTKAVRRLPILIAALLIFFVPVLLVVTLGFGATLASAGLTDPAAVTPEALASLPKIRWLLLFLTLFFIIVGVRLFPVSAIAVSEAVGPLKLLKRSWELTRGVFWRVLVVLLLLAIAALLLDYAITVVVGSVATLAAGEPRPFNLSALIVAVPAGLAGAMVSSVSAAMVGRVYAQLSAAETSVPKN